VDRVDHHPVARPEVLERHDERAVVARRPADACVRVRHPRARPRAPEVARDRACQHAVAAGGEEGERGAQVALEPVRLPIRRAHVVHAHVQAADVEARLRVRGACREGRGLDPRHVGGPRAVDRVGRERQPEPARDPQRPGLQRDAPLQLAAAVRDRVAQGEHPVSAGHARAG